MKTGFLKSFAQSKKMKYSTISVIFTAIVVTTVILFNTMISVIADANNWYIDMTEEQVFSLSDTTKNLIKEASSNTEIEIIFTSEKDLLENKRTTHQASVGFVVATAEELANEFDNITVSYHNSLREKAFMDELRKKAGAGVTVTENSIIVARKDENGNYAEVRAYGVNNFFANDEYNNIHAYGGEITFASAILGLTAKEKPAVYFTVGHEELSFDRYNSDTEVNYSNAELNQTATTGANREAIGLMKTFTEAGYVVKPLDLKNGIPEDATIIVINAPARDFVEDEIDYLKHFLLNQEEPGTVFCFLDKERAFIDEENNASHDTNVIENFTRLNSLIETMTGAKIVADFGYVQDEDTRDSQDYFAINGVFPQNVAIDQYLPAHENAVIRYTNSVYIDKLNKDYWDGNADIGDGSEGSFLSSTKPLVTTSKNAYIQVGSEIRKDTYNLMTMTAINYWRESTQDEITSYFLLSASSEVVSVNNLQDGAYINRDLMYSVIRTTGGSQIGAPLGVEYKNFIDYDLEISTKQARTTTFCLALIIPSILIATGVIVIVKRKRR